jgi:hypothetical protein
MGVIRPDLARQDREQDRWVEIVRGVFWAMMAALVLLGYAAAALTVAGVL